MSGFKCLFVFVFESIVFLILIVINLANSYFKELVRMAGKIPVKAVLIDLSGTLHVEDTALPGAVEALKRYFVTSSY